MATAVPPPGGQYPPQQQQQQQDGPGAPVPDSYFTESRKGEINELRNLLRGFATERDPQRKRDIIKKVIAYMTLGIDVSRLFTEMMLAIETRCVPRVLFVLSSVINNESTDRTSWGMLTTPKSRKTLLVCNIYNIILTFLLRYPPPLLQKHTETWSLRRWCTCT